MISLVVNFFFRQLDLVEPGDHEVVKRVEVPQSVHKSAEQHDNSTQTTNIRKQVEGRVSHSFDTEHIEFSFYRD